MAKKLKKLNNWDWSTLVASWRYFEYRMTIASATFPSDIVKRYFSGAYDETECERIAHQFAEVDHGLRGETDWIEMPGLMDCDRTPWCLFYAFCKAYCKGFSTILLEGDCDGKHIHREAKAFYSEYTKHWYDADTYRKSAREWYFIDELVHILEDKR